MDLYLEDRYPTEAAFGACYLTRASQGEVVEDTADGPVVRREKVIVTSLSNDYEGRICVGERAVRHLAHRLDMVDGWRHRTIVDDNAALRGELVELSAAMAQAQQTINLLRNLKADDGTVKVYVAVDGSMHASARGAREAGQAVQVASIASAASGGAEWEF